MEIEKTENQEQKTQDSTGNAELEQKESVSFADFQTVTKQKEEAEQMLESVLNGLIETLPEDVRHLVPDLLPDKKLAWINEAKKAGLFEKKAVLVDSPDPKKPLAKPDLDLNNASPYSMLKHGYK